MDKGLDLLLKITKGLVNRLDTAIDVPGEHLLGITRGVARDKAEALELVLGVDLVDKLKGLHLGTPLERLGELLLGLGEIPIVGIQILLKDDLAWDVGGRVRQRDAPDLRMAVVLSKLWFVSFGMF